jgi:hypothetical protein
VPIGQGVSQISPPIRILLVCAVAFIAAWTLFLKPKSASSTAPAAATPAPNVQTGAPAQSFAGKMAQKAKDAVAKANGTQAAGTEAAAGAHAGTATKAHAVTSRAEDPALPAAALRKLPKDVARALKARKVLVLGVIATDGKPWRPIASDDKLVQRALRHVNRYHGAVFVKKVSLLKLAGYGPLFAGLEINQTPSVVVVDRKLKATTIAGYLDLVSINQAIADAYRTTTEPLLKDRFLRRLNSTCAQYGTLLYRFPLPADRSERKTWSHRLFKLAGERRAAFAAIGAPGRWQPLKARLLRDMDADVATARKLLKDAKTHNWSQFVADYKSIDAAEGRSLDRKLNSVGANACVADRRS